MRKSKAYISSIITFSLLLGFLATASADADTDYSGDWIGQWYCDTHRNGADLSINLTQNAAFVNGTLAMNRYACLVENWAITGTITGNVLSFKAIGTCNGVNSFFEVSQALLSTNQLSGGYTIYRDGNLYCTGNINLTRLINPISYIINASAGSGGTITPVGNISVNAGANQTFNISPNDGYKIVDVQVDGASVGAINSYNFSDVAANHSILATFKKEPFLPSLQLLLE